MLSSPFNPALDFNGYIFITTGNHISAISKHRSKAGFDYAVTRPWTVGADLNVIGSRYLTGDHARIVESNRRDALPIEKGAGRVIVAIEKILH